MEPGIYKQIPFGEYASWPGWNPSAIKTLLAKSPGAMRYGQQHPSSTDSMDIGRAAHSAILTPELFGLEYVVYPGARRAGKDWDLFCEEHAGKEIMTASQYEAVLGMSDAVRAHRPAADLLSEAGDAEVSLAWTDPSTGAACKGRIDYLSSRSISLKTCADSSPRAFSRQAADLYYHVAEAAYLSGLWANGSQCDQVFFICVNNRPYHDVVVYEASPSFMRRGLDLWEQGLRRVLECERTGIWPGACPETFLLELPTWAQGLATEFVSDGEPVFEEV